MKRRVVITGMGAVSPFGVGVDTLWRKLIIGKSCIRFLDIDLNRDIYTPYGAFISKFNFDHLFCDSWKYKKYIDRAMEFFLVATAEACRQANYFEDLELLNSDRIGVYIGTTTAGHLSAYNQALSYFTKNKPFSRDNIFQCTPGSWPLVVDNYLKASGPMKSFCISCSAGGESIGNAFRDIADGKCDMIITGGGDAPISKINYLSFYLIKATSRWKGNPSEGCQPYSLNRPGMVFGEGAGVLVLEEYQHAIMRGANILGEILNYTANTDAFHIVAPEPNAIQYGEVIKCLFNGTKITAKDIGYISCHGTGTQKNDVAETKAIKYAFGKHAGNIKMSSIKSMIGHAFGGSTAIEIISLVKALSEQIAPPTANYKEFDIECDLDCIPNVATRINSEFGIKIATGFGGSNNAILVKRIK